MNASVWPVDFFFLPHSQVSFCYSLHDCIQAKVLNYCILFLFFLYVHNLDKKNDCIVNESKIFIRFRCSSLWAFSKTSVCNINLFSGFCCVKLHLSRFLIPSSAVPQCTSYSWLPLLFYWGGYLVMWSPLWYSKNVCASLVCYSKRTASAISESLYAFTILIVSPKNIFVRVLF